VYPFKFMIPLAGGMLLLQGIVEIVRCVQCIRRRRVAVARAGRRGGRRRQAQGNGAREGRGHRRLDKYVVAARRGVQRQMKIRKELWFGFILMALIIAGTAVMLLMASTITNGHLGLLMLALVVVAIMLGFPTAFTLMGMGMIFTWLAYEARLARRWT
jgi:hypothetical protein